jgi:hypothetical protein
MSYRVRQIGMVPATYLKQVRATGRGRREKT